MNELVFLVCGGHRQAGEKVCSTVESCFRAYLIPSAAAALISRTVGLSTTAWSWLPFKISQSRLRISSTLFRAGGVAHDISKTDPLWKRQAAHSPPEIFGADRLHASTAISVAHRTIAVFNLVASAGSAQEDKAPFVTRSSW